MFDVAACFISTNNKEIDTNLLYKRKIYIHTKTENNNDTHGDTHNLFLFLRLQVSTTSQRKGGGAEIAEATACAWSTATVGLSPRSVYDSRIGKRRTAASR